MSANLWLKKLNEIMMRCTWYSLEEMAPAKETIFTDPIGFI